MVGVCAGIAAYIALTSAARLTAQSLSTLLAVFLATGVFISMLAADNPLWWTGMFSTLGTWQSGLTSFWSFNVTLVVSGLVMSTLTAFIVRDLSLMARLHDDYARAMGRPPARFMRPRPAVVRVCLLGLGICTMGIGLVPIDVAEPVHSWLARLAVGFIAVLLLGAAFWLPGFPVAFHLFTLACLLGIIGAGLLWRPFRYYDLTAFELAIVGTTIGWLAVFVRTTSAALAVDEKALEGPLPSTVSRPAPNTAGRPADVAGPPAAAVQADWPRSRFRFSRMMCRMYPTLLGVSSAWMCCSRAAAWASQSTGRAPLRRCRAAWAARASCA